MLGLTVAGVKRPGPSGWACYSSGMTRYVAQGVCGGALLAVLAALPGCTVPSGRETVAQTAELVSRQTGSAPVWRRQPAEDGRLRQDIQPLLEGGLTAEEAVAVAFLASPDLQLALEQLELGRSDLVAAFTLPNPVAIVGQRSAGGRLAPFYPDRSLSVGVLQNVLALLQAPQRQRVAELDLARLRLQTADQLVGLAAEVNQTWLEYAAALRIQGLRERAAAAGRAALDLLVVQAANHGQPTAFEMALERNGVLVSESLAVRARLEADTLRARLARQMGLSGWQDDWRIEGELADLPVADPVPEALEALALQQRLDLREAREALASRLEALKFQRRYRWLGSLELGVFRDGTGEGLRYTGPNAVVELPLFDQRQSELLAADAQWRSARRTLEVRALAARTEIRTHAAEVAATRRLLEQYRSQVMPNQRQLLVQTGQGIDPGSVERLKLRQGVLASEEEAVGYLRDYWRARSALARAAGDWRGLLR